MDVQLDLFEVTDRSRALLVADWKLDAGQVASIGLRKMKDAIAQALG